MGRMLTLQAKFVYSAIVLVILMMFHTVLDIVFSEDQSVPKDHSTHLNSFVLDRDRNSPLDFSI